MQLRLYATYGLLSNGLREVINSMVSTSQVSILTLEPLAPETTSLPPTPPKLSMTAWCIFTGDLKVHLGSTSITSIIYITIYLLLLSITSITSTSITSITWVRLLYWRSWFTIGFV